MIESELIYNCQKGNKGAFKLLVERYASQLMAICIRYLKDDFTAQDVLQESFIIIFKKIKTYRDEGSFEGWISKITVRCALQELRKNRKQKLVFLDIDPNQEESLISDFTSAEIELELNERDILKMINLLPDHYRIIFNMYIIEGYSHAEIAELLDIGESTSRTKLTRARKKIQIIYTNMMDANRTSEANYKKSYEK